MSLPRNNPGSLPHRLSLALAGASIVMAIVVLIGWQFDIDALTTVGLSKTLFMAPNTALWLVLAGIAVFLGQRPLGNRYTEFVARSIGFLLFLFSAATIFEYVTHVNLGIDDLFMRSRLSDWRVTPTPGRFAIQTAIAFTCIGGAIVLLDRVWQSIRWSELLSGVSLFIAFLGLVGYAYKARSLYGVMALHTAISMAVLSIATLLMRPGKGAVGLFFGRSAAGIALRRTLIVTILALTFFGWVRVMLERLHLVSSEGGTSLMVFASVVFVCGLLIRTSFALQALEDERESARRALAESELRYRSIFEYSKEGIALYEPVVDDDGVVSDWLIKDANAAFISGSGKDRVHTIGHRLSELFGGRDEMGAYFNAANDVFLTGKARQFEAYFAPLKRYYIASIFPIADRLLASTTIDITKSKQAEQLVRDSELRYRQIVETASEGIWMLDDNMRISFVNDRFAGFLGYEVREMLGQRKFDFVFEEDASFIQTLFDQRRNAQRAVVDVRFRHKDGTERWMMMSAAPIIDARGVFHGALDMFTDITERRATVQALRASEARFRELADSMPQMVWTADASGRFIYSNRRYAEYTGNTGDNQNADWTSAVHPEDLPDVLRRWNIALSTGREFNVEARLRRATDHSDRWHLIRAVPSFEADGRVARWYGTCTDVHESKLAEEAMMKSEKLAATGRLAATIAHEINNPLEAVTNLVFLAQNTAVPEQSREFLTLASEELQRVAHITKQTLGFYRETAAPARVKVGNVLESVISLYERKIESKDIRLEKRFVSDAEIEAIPGELRQVFSNLISNSIDAVDHAGTLCVGLRAIGHGTDFRGVRIIVADNGVGISPDIRQQVFEPFFTTKRDFGTGLGLWVTRQIIRRHGGSIRVRSSIHPPHRGTHFSVFLPAKVAMEVEETGLKIATA
jgi:PAS domain S-box-containing protein